MADPRGPRYPGSDEDDFGGEPGGDKDLFDIIPERLSQPSDGPLDDEPRKGRSLLIAALLIGVAVAGGAGWYLLTGSTATDGKVSAPTIPADPNPYKVRPADPGGMQVPNQDKLVYDRLDPGAQQADGAQVEKLLPEPQAPQAPSVSTAPPPSAAQPPAVEPRTPARDGVGDGMTAPPPPMPSIAGGPSGGQAPAVTRPEAVSGIEKPVPSPATERPETAALPAPQAPATQPAPAAQAPAAQAPAAQAPTAQPAPAPAPAQPAATQTAAMGTGPYMVQLAALRDEASVRKSWQSLQAKHPDLLGNLKMVIERADLGDKGVFYRLRATGLPTEDAGRALCDELAKKKVGCLFVGK